MPANESMQQLQEEALRRIREMHSRAHPPEPPSEPPPPAEPARETAPPGGHPGGILEQLSLDKDRTVILALLLLLGSDPDGGHSDLLLALLFLLL